jgi:hypothetical protein|tara:strand:+ start:2900 stop:3922 length:1023 start_codon:yes stop_codon:yes gene_type:complete
MTKQYPAQEYPSNIFKQTTPDEEQALTDQPRFQTWYKGWLTRSEIYERKLPDGLTSALRIDGPGDSAFSLDDKGNVRILTGKRDPEKGAGSGILGIKTWGQQQLHNERSNLQYAAGSDEEGQALNVLCYGDYVENSKGGTRYIYATKIILSATSELVLEGGSIKLQSESDISMAAAAINTAQVNKKDIVLGETKKEALGTDTTNQFDPRATQTFNTPGNLQRNVAGDYRVSVGGCYHSFAAGGPGGLIPSRTFGYYAGTSTNAALGGTLAAGLYSAGEMDLLATKDVFVAGADFSITAGAIDATAADVNLDAGAFDATVASFNVTSAGDVRFTGTKIYLN